MSAFSKKEVLQYGWQTVRQKMGYFAGLSVIYILASVALAPLQSYFSETPALAFVFGILSFALSLIVDLGFMKIVLKTYDQEPNDMPDLFRYYDLSPRYFLSTILYSLLVIFALIPGIIAIGLFAANGVDAESIGIAEGVLIALVLGVPAIYVMVRFYFFGYFIIDQEAGPIESLKRSFQLTTGHTGQLTILFFLFLFIALAGILSLLIGIIIAYPITTLGTAYVFRKLLEAEDKDIVLLQKSE